MGCASSTKATLITQAERRRLSVGYVDGEDGVREAPTKEGDRGLITKLNQESLLELLHSDRKVSVGSDMDANTKQSFKNKQMKQIGDEIDLADLGIGYTCRKGLKPESPNQDSWFAIRLDNLSVYGVLDGHGKAGHDCSNFVKETMPKLLCKDSRFKEGDRKQLLVDVFLKTQDLIVTADRIKTVSAQLAGTTATVAIHDHVANKITLAHVADSTAVLGTFKDKTKTKMVGTALTRDHKPNLPDERARIESNGGRVVFDGYANHRVYAKKHNYPGLNMSRCLGDILGHESSGIIAEPETSEHSFTEDDHLLLLCSDGVWEFITAQQAVDIIADSKPTEALKAADKLAKEAWDRWIREEGGSVVDDITVLLVYPHIARKAADQ